MSEVIIILGPTCVGKTGASVLMAEEMGTEIIGADSMQVYKHMDIGTEKPTPEERARVRHHMIDVVEPTEGFSAGRFIEEARPIIDRLISGNKTPIIVGGTGLYIKAMTRGLFRGPSADRGLREDLMRTEAEEQGALYRMLQKADPEAATGIVPTDIRRIVRALEVSISSGRPISELRKDLTQPLPYEFKKIGLTRDRDELYAMIEARVDNMLARGLVDEVRKLLAMGPDITPLQAIGYKEVAAYIRGEYPLEEAARLIKRNTKRYAKRQFTWFRKEEGVRWVDVSGLGSAGEVYNRIKEVMI